MSTPPATSSSVTAPTDLSRFIERIKGMLLDTQQTWVAVAAEDDSIARIYKTYLAWLLLIPAVAGFIGTSLVGVSAFGVTIRVPVLQGVLSMVMSFVLALGMAYLVAMIASALAPRFGGTAHLPSAFKLVAYGATAALVGGVFQLIPLLGLLGLIAGAYSIYLFYVGVPLMLGVPKQRAMGYTAVLVVCAVLLSMVVGWVSSWMR